MGFLAKRERHEPLCLRMYLQGWVLVGTLLQFNVGANFTQDNAVRQQQVQIYSSGLSSYKKPLHALHASQCPS